MNLLVVPDLPMACNLFSCSVALMLPTIVCLCVVVVKAQVQQGMLCVWWEERKELLSQHGSREDCGEMLHSSQGQVGNDG